MCVCVEVEVEYFFVFVDFDVMLFLFFESECVGFWVFYEEFDVDDVDFVK